MAIKKIVLPTDFSLESAHALEAALDLASQMSAELDIIHAIDLPFFEVEMQEEGVREAYRSGLQKYAKDKMAHFVSGTGAITIRSFVEFGKVEDVVTRFSRNNDVDIIVMGSKGDTSTDNLSGSNTGKVINKASCPVLVIKEKPHPQMFREIVFASDFNENVPEETVNILKSLQRLFFTKVHFIHVITPEKFISSIDIQAKMEVFVKVFDFDNYTIQIVTDKTVESGILAYTNFMEAGIIALGTHGDYSWHSFNISRGLINKQSSPILTFKIDCEEA